MNRYIAILLAAVVLILLMVFSVLRWENSCDNDFNKRMIGLGLAVGDYTTTRNTDYSVGKMPYHSIVAYDTNGKQITALGYKFRLLDLVTLW